MPASSDMVEVLEFRTTTRYALDPNGSRASRRFLRMTGTDVLLFDHTVAACLLSWRVKRLVAHLLVTYINL